MRRAPPDEPADDHWIQVRRDAATGIESVRAHFRGHAYDPHDHDEILVGVTQQGVQRFRCQRAIPTCTPGRAPYGFAMFSTSHDAANCAAFLAEHAERPDRVGLALRGPRKAVDRAVKGLARHR